MRRWNGTDWDTLYPKTSADVVVFDDTNTDLTAGDVQEAIEVIDTNIGNITALDTTATNLVGAVNEVKDDVDNLILDWTIEGDEGDETANTGDTVRYIGNPVIKTDVTKDDDEITVEFATPDVDKGDIVIATDDEILGTLGIGIEGQVLRVGANDLPIWTTGGSVDEELTLTFDGGETLGTDLYTFDGADPVTIDFIGGTDIDISAASGAITLNHANITRTDTTNAASPAFAGTFDVVDGITTSATGHITAVNLKTVTVPTETTLSVTDGTSSTGVFVDDVAVSDHAITVNRSNTTQNTITVGELVVSETGAGNGNITIDGALRGPNQFFIDAADSQGAYGQIGGEVVILGDLIVRGVTTTVNSEDVTIKDAFIRLNFDAELENPGSFAPVTNAGIEIERYSETNVRLLWDETDDDWYVTNGIVLQNQQDILNETGAQTFSQFQLFHEGNFVIPMVDQPIDDYSGPVYQGAMVYEVLETITLATTTTTTTGGGGFPPPPE